MLGINIPENEIGDWKIETINGECSLFKNTFHSKILIVKTVHHYFF